MPLRARHALRALLVAALVSVGLVGTAPQASAEGPSQVSLLGHGNGHGRGLGQFGAKGYATSGWSAAQILSHYYGGTSAGTQPPAGLRVLLCDLESVTICSSGNGVSPLVVTSPAQMDFEGIDKPFPVGTALRITRDSARNGWVVEQAGGGCSATTFTPVGEGFTGDAVVDLDPDGAPLQVCVPKQRTYRGSLKVAMHEGKPRVVNFVGSVEDYLKGVVPAEMPSSWPAEALKAQAVAARSYVLAGDNRFGGFADTCDTTLCQVYRGLSAEQATTNAAIDQTAGQVRMKDGAVARTEFSSSTGGYTAGGAFPAVVDEGDATPDNPHHNWTVTVQATQIEQAYPTIGDFQGFEILERNGLGAEGGRVVRLRVIGSSANVSVTGNGLRSSLGLKSDWFTPGIALVRLSAADRYGTAAAIARNSFPSSDVALLARGDGAESFADGLAANYLAGLQGAPTLLTKQGELPAVTLDTLKDLGVETVRLLGGPEAISEGVASALTTQGFTVARIAGPDRFGTAAAVAKAAPAASVGTMDGKRTAILSSGRAFPDALAAGSIVFAAHYPQLLTEPGSLPAATAAAITDLGIKHVIITGGAAAVAPAVEQAVQALGVTTERVAGADRYDTAVQLADVSLNRFGFAGGHIDVATGEAFPDALTGGVHAGKLRTPIVLSARTSVPGSTCGFLQRRDAIGAGHVFGGTAAIDDATKANLESCLRS